MISNPRNNGVDGPCHADRYRRCRRPGDADEVMVFPVSQGVHVALIELRHDGQPDEVIDIAGVSVPGRVTSWMLASSDLS
jgi:hypothetical protein